MSKEIRTKDVLETVASIFGNAEKYPCRHLATITESNSHGTITRCMNCEKVVKGWSIKLD